MRLRVKDIDISTGGTIVAVLYEHDAHKLDLHPEDRVRLRKGRRETIAIIDIAESGKAVPKGKIGLMEEALQALGAKQGDFVELSLEQTPASVQYIKRKLDGARLEPREINEIVADIVNNRLSRIEMTYFVSACYKSGLSKQEVVALTKAMVRNGKVLKLKSKVIVDKHCIGGVAGNRTTMVVVPIVAAGGLVMPKTSSRSITSPSGTADTMEVLAEVGIPISKMKRIVERINACIVWGGAFNLAAADDKLIRLRHPLSLDPPGMVLSSVLAKKHAVSATHVLIDIPIGRGAKIDSQRVALDFKKQFEAVGRELTMKVRVVLTNGSQPIGNGIGPGLEARDVMWVLEGEEHMPLDLRSKCLELAGEIFEMAGKSRKGKGKRLAEQLIDSGKAHDKMVEIIKAQGGNPKAKIRLAKYSFDVRAKKAGKVGHIDNKQISRIARIAGAPLDKGAGIYLHSHKGERVRRGDVLYTVFGESEDKLKFAANIVKVDNGFILK